MIIELPYKDLDAIMSTVNVVISDRTVPDNLRNLIVINKDNQKAQFAAWSPTNTVLLDSDATISLEGSEFTEDYSAIRAKDINNIIGVFKGVKRTVVDKVQFHISEKETTMFVFEEPANPDDEGADKYRQRSRFKVQRMAVTRNSLPDLQAISLEPKGSYYDESIPDALDTYFAGLYPTIQKEERDNTYNMMFGDSLYTALNQYVSIMPNGLPEDMRGFRVANSLVNFLRNFINKQPFYFNKKEHERGFVELTVGVGRAVAVLKVKDMTNVFNITGYASKPENVVTLDRAYLLDVIKRLSLSADTIELSINFDKTVPTFKVTSKAMTQEVPIWEAHGTGVFDITLRPELLSSMIFSHLDLGSTTINLNIGEMGRDEVEMSCSDESEYWVTKARGLSRSKAAFGWN